MKNCNSMVPEDDPKPSSDDAMKADKGRKGCKGYKVRLIIPMIAAMVLISSIALVMILARRRAKYTSETSIVVSTITPPCEVISLSAPSPSPVPPLVTKLSQPMPGMFYIRQNTVYHASGEEFKPKGVANVPQYVGDAFFIRINEAGTTILYPQIFTGGTAEPSSELYCCDLTAENPIRYKLGKGIQQTTLSPVGSKVAYIDQKALYVYDFHQTRKLAEDVTEFYMDQTGDRFLYITTDSRLILLEANKPAREIDSVTCVEYVSKDLNTILYIKRDISEDQNTIFYTRQDSLYLVRDREAPQRIDSGVRAILTGSVCEDGSFYYFKARALMQADYVDDDLAAADAALNPPVRSDFSDAADYSLALQQFEKKSNRDAIRQALQDSEKIETFLNSLYYYHDGRSTKISDYTKQAWAYPSEKKQEDPCSLEERPFLAYSELNPGKVKISEVASYEDILTYILDYRLIEENYVCSGAEVLGKFYDGTIYQLRYDTKNSIVHYITNYRDQKHRGDLYGVTIRDARLSENRLFAEDIYYSDPEHFFIADSVVYLTTGNNLAEDYWLFVNQERVGSRVARIFPIKNSDAFLFISNISDKGDTLSLYKDGKVTEISDRVDSCCALDENNIAYVVAGEYFIRQLYLYDGSQTRKLLDQFVGDEVVFTDFVEPSE
ncbi:MAG: hypothetical protein KBA53_02240 [Thermoclostridium sp.]|nr:hypothetical protein [Thermoclostridium sp.]